MICTGMVADLHIRAAQLGRHLDVIGIYDIDPHRMSERAAAWGIPGRASLDNVLRDSDVEAVLILTPAETHSDLAIRALECGKHVLVEKPVARASDIGAIAQAARAAGKICLPGHNYAYDQDFSRVRSLVKAGQLGTIRAMFIHYVIAHSREIARHYDGVLAEVMIHHAYLTLATLGLPRTVTAGVAVGAEDLNGVEDQAWMTWEYEDGLTAHLFATFAVDDNTSAPWLFSLKVLGTKGGATYDWRGATYRRPLGSLPIAVAAYEDSYILEHRAFAYAVHGDNSLVASSLHDAHTAQLLLDLAHESARTGQRIVVADHIPVDEGRP